MTEKEIERLKLNHAVEIAPLHEYRREFPIFKRRALEAEAEVQRLKEELRLLREKYGEGI